MDLDPVRLRTLDKIATLGSMTAAARALGYTTGAISQQMAALERATGHTLFLKVGRNVQLTDAGVILAKHGQRILAAHEAAEAELEDTEGSPAVPVNVGVWGTTAGALLAPALGAIAERHPALEIHSIEVDVDDAIAAVGRGDVDLAFGVDYDDAPIPRATDVQLVELRTEGFSIGFRTGSLRPGRSVMLGSLASEPWILPPERTHYGLAMRLACRRAGFEPVVAHEVTDTAATLAMAANGLGVAPVTDLMLQWRSKDLEVIPLRTPVNRRLVLARRSDPSIRLSVRVVAEALARFVKTDF